MIRLIDEKQLIALIQYALDAETELASVKRAGDLRRWIREQPSASFVGSTAAASILGIAAPHVARLRKAERMPEALPVEGGYPVYLRSEVEALADELGAERQARKA